MTKEEFFTYFLDFFKEKSISINKELLPEALDYLINHTGILYLQEKKYVKFKHDSFMEYYAALEFYHHKRDKESDLINNFLELNWQNTAIFYAGKSKDMPIFLTKIIAKLKQCTTLVEYFTSINAMGYLLQALYMTDSNIRKEGVLASLESNIASYDLMFKLAAEDFYFFKNLKLPLIAIINSYNFLENFNSVTLRDPLNLAFKDLLNKYKELDENDENRKASLGFKLFNLSLTMSSSRIGDQSQMEALIYQTDILKHPLFSLLFDFGIEIAGSKKLHELRKDLKNQFNKISESRKHYLDVPASKLRFTAFDQIHRDKKIKLITEGKTDAEIIEHAFRSITGDLPYWNIEISGDGKGGGASALKRHLECAKPIINDDQVIIGIFDNDSAGLGQFNGLPNTFEFLGKSKRIKKHRGCSIYAIKLPVPAEKQHYIQEKQEFNFFEIEHYLPLPFLKENNMVKETGLPDVFEIIEKNKNKLKEIIKKETDKDLFEDFILLFTEIDSITGINIDYSN